MLLAEEGTQALELNLLAKASGEFQPSGAGGHSPGPRFILTMQELLLEAENGAQGAA